MWCVKTKIFFYFIYFSIFGFSHFISVPPVPAVGSNYYSNELHQIYQVPARQAGGVGLHLLDQDGAVHLEAAQALLL